MTIDPEQQPDASRIGMWMFLATEIMFFGGMFMGYILYRTDYSALRLPKPAIMHVRYRDRLTWVFAGAGFFWLVILITLTM